MRPALAPTIILSASLAFLSPYSAAAGTPSGDGQAEAEKAEAARLARLEREKEAERQRIERERQCVIKPVMTDAEIAKCKEVWR